MEYKNLNIFTDFGKITNGDNSIPEMSSDPYVDHRNEILYDRVSTVLKTIHIERVNEHFVSTIIYPQFLLLLSISEYLYFEAATDEQNMYMIVELLQMAMNRSSRESDLDKLFEQYNRKIKSFDGVPIAIKHYEEFKKVAKGEYIRLAALLRKNLYPLFCANDDLLAVAKTKNTSEAVDWHWQTLEDNFPEKFANKQKKELENAKYLFSSTLDFLFVNTSNSATIGAVLQEIKKLENDDANVLEDILEFFDEA